MGPRVQRMTPREGAGGYHRRMRFLLRPALSLLLVTVLATALAGCGDRGASPDAFPEAPTADGGLAALPEDQRDYRWPRFSENVLTPIFTHEIERRNAEILTYLPERGDVLFWHGRLLHRGSKPNDSTIPRRSLIAHYSGINHRQDMPKALKHNDGWYFPIDGGNNV